MSSGGVPKILKKKTFYLISFFFSFGYITKRDTTSESGENMNFIYNYMDVHFFHLHF